MSDIPATMHAVLLTGHGGIDRLEYRDASIRYHEEIIDAVEKQDGAQARPLMESHIREVGDRIWQESGD